VRRLAAAVLSAVLFAALGVAGAAPAAAHVCPVPVQIAVGQPSTISVGVTVEDATVPDVELDLPAALALERIDPAAGWTATRTGSSVRYRGGPIRPFQCAYFSLGVTAQGRGAFGIGVVTRDANGKVIARTTPDPQSASDRVLDQFVYAGVKPPSPDGSKGPAPGLVAGIALVVLGGAFVVVLAVRSRRSSTRDEPRDGEPGPDGSPLDDELRARLERFREQTPRVRPRD
jgi:hypothetical protein